MRKIGIIIGSESDLDQCVEGLEYLNELSEAGKIEISNTIIASLHRNTKFVLDTTRVTAEQNIDVLIAGAGWANHLTGTVDAYLRYHLKNNKVVVVGVAFEDRSNPDHTMAAILSITQVPKTQVVFNDYVGAEGFLRACKFAVSGELPKIKSPEPKNITRVSIQKMLENAIKIKEKKEK